MKCYVVSCGVMGVMWSYALPCGDMCRYVALCGVTWRYVGLNGFMSRYVALCDAM